MAAKEKKTRKPRKPQDTATQGWLDPSLAPPTIKEIDEAAEDYRNARDARMNMSETESQAAEELLKLMQSHNLLEYEYDGQIVRVMDVLKVRVSKAKAEKPSKNGEEE